MYIYLISLLCIYYDYYYIYGSTLTYFEYYFNKKFLIKKLTLFSRIINSSIYYFPKYSSSLKLNNN